MQPVRLQWIPEVQQQYLDEVGLENESQPGEDGVSSVHDISSTLCWCFRGSNPECPFGSSAAQERDPLEEICKGASSTEKKQDYRVEGIQHDYIV